MGPCLQVWLLKDESDPVGAHQPSFSRKMLLWEHFSCKAQCGDECQCKTVTAWL